MYFRLFQPGDFLQCQELLPSGFRAEPRVREALPSLWRRLLEDGQLHGGVVCERDRHGAEAIAAFGMSVFVPRAFVETQLREPRPFVSAHVYERLLARSSPILTVREVAAANAAGSLNLLILHFGMHLSSPPTAHQRTVVAAAHAGFRVTHEGYHVERVLQEVYGATHVAFMSAGGFRVVSDFTTSDDVIETPPAQRPWVMAVARSDPEAQLPGTVMSYLFQYTPPRFSFTPAEQRVLQRTLLDESDETIADALGISRDAVKKAWRSIYQRVAAAAPGLMVEPDIPGTSMPGAERRKHLIKYLRHHLEELRPFRSAGAPRIRR